MGGPMSLARNLLKLPLGVVGVPSWVIPGRSKEERASKEMWVNFCVVYSLLLDVSSGHQAGERLT